MKDVPSQHNVFMGAVLTADIAHVGTNPGHFIMTLVRYGALGERDEQDLVFREAEGLRYNDVIMEGLGLLVGRLERASVILRTPTNALAQRALDEIQSQQAGTRVGRGVRQHP